MSPLLEAHSRNPFRGTMGENRHDFHCAVVKPSCLQGSVQRNIRKITKNQNGDSQEVFVLIIVLLICS
jgi:hypothetical protein